MYFEPVGDERAYCDNCSESTFEVIRRKGRLIHVCTNCSAENEL